MKKINILLGLLFFACVLAWGQTPADVEKEYNLQYERNIKKERIQGVYIPNDMEEAFEEIKALSDPLSLQKFASAIEDTISRKLHFGLGRWISHNWNFYEGSRFSHYLKAMGVTHPDDMIQFVIVSFHRHLNNKNLMLEERAQAFAAHRKSEQKLKMEAAQIISEEKTKKEKN